MEPEHVYVFFLTQLQHVSELINSACVAREMFAIKACCRVNEHMANTLFHVKCSLLINLFSKERSKKKK